jgi:hypothetical protein
VAYTATYHQLLHTSLWRYTIAFVHCVTITNSSVLHIELSAWEPARTLVHVHHTAPTAAATAVMSNQAYNAVHYSILQLAYISVSHHY